MVSSLLHQSSAVSSKALRETTETVESATLERNLGERFRLGECSEDPDGVQRLVELSREKGLKSQKSAYQPIGRGSTMPFCPNCGAQADFGTSFCSKCGASLKTIIQSRDSIRPSTKETGSELEDSVAAYFRGMGFDVDSRTKMRDRFDVFHEIDVLASKIESFGTIRVAVECKHVESRIDIKEVRNFHDKLAALGITKGILASTGGFTTDAQSHAKALGIELWDTKTLREKLASTEQSQGDVIHDALPFTQAALGELPPRHLQNFSLLSESVQFEYRPFYFVDFHCFSQHTVRENSIVIEAKGTVVIDGVSGQLVDRKMSMSPPSQQPIHPGVFAECIGMPTQTVTSVRMPAQIPLSVAGPRIDSTRARDIARMELIKTIAVQYRYHTTRTTGTKILKPKKKDIEILNAQAVKIPLLTGVYRFKNHTYVRTILATTRRTIMDQTLSCVQCNSLSTHVCENCGSVVCASHVKNCVICGRKLCGTCVISKGIISKKHYCSEHQLQK